MKRVNLIQEEKPRLLRFGLPVVYCLLVVVLITLIVLNHRSYFGIPAWCVNVPVAGMLLIENAVKFWGFKNYKAKIVCYVFDILCLMTLTIFFFFSLISVLYMIILSEFYLNSKGLGGSIAICVSSIVLFLITFGISALFKRQWLSLTQIFTNAFNDLILLIFHFLIVNFAVQLFRKNKELASAVEDVNKTNEKLRIAYEELKEITALEERQRIAKDIHDTAGHSITTVIMQTEAAKLAVENDPQEAKRRIAAANLQAKHALEELRESVHLLSGVSREVTLKEEILDVINDSTDGTGIVIRCDVDDVTLCDAKRRFVLNTLKEGISNGLRHGNATAFYFELKNGGDRVEFMLSDNGCGMELSSLKEGFGLTGMHARAESLGGSVYFETEPDEGFEIHLNLPMDEEGDKK